MRIISVVLLLLNCCAVYAQSPKGRIKGKILDAATHQPVEFAAVVLTDQQTKKLVTGATTDAAGAYNITDVPDGHYFITVEFVGYKRDTLNGVVVSPTNRDLKLSPISLSSSTHALKDVTVTAALPVIENKIDKLIYNVANDITSQGGVAMDVLRKVPQIGVDIDGNVDIQGNGNVRFLINGKPSSIFNSPVDALSSIPASQIKSIEVISSPGAKYDAEGTGGIINIILKDNRLQGINGNVNLSAGTRLENGSANLSMRKGNVGINAFFSGNAQLISRTPNSQDRTALNTDHLTQNGYSDLQRNGYQSGLGFDWNISKKDGITATVAYNHFENKLTNYYDQRDSVSGAPAITGFRNSNTSYTNNTIDMSLAYKHDFKKEGQEISVLYSSSFGSPVNDYTLAQTYTGQTNPYNGSEGHSPGKDKEFDMSADYTHPVNDKVTLETGVKTTLQRISSIDNVNVLDTLSRSYAYDPTQSYGLNYGRDIYAGYLSGNFSIGKLKVKAGFRYEHTDTRLDLANTPGPTGSVPSYDSYVPSLILARDLKHDQTIKFSYSHRIERPGYQQLNPFVNRSDPNNLTTGNVLLQPEIGDNFELSYYKAFSKLININISVFERMDAQDLKPVTIFHEEYIVGNTVYTNVSVSNQQNIGAEYNTGITFNGSATVLHDKLNIHLFVLGAQRYVVSKLAPDSVSSTGYRFRFNTNCSYQLPRNLVVEGFANYNSASQLLQGRVPQSLTYTFACRKQFWDKKASVGLTATNIFSKYIEQVTTVVTNTYISTAVRELPYRSVGVSFTYKFGKLEIKKPKDEDSYFIRPPDNGGGGN